MLGDCYISSEFAVTQKIGGTTSVSKLVYEALLDEQMHSKCME